LNLSSDSISWRVSCVHVLSREQVAFGRQAKLPRESPQMDFKFVGANEFKQAWLDGEDSIG
jgi:hypothetical protein